MSFRPPLRECRTWSIDSRRWASYRPRPDDVVIATCPKSGTIWMQRVVSLLIFQDPAPRPVMDISVWIDRRFGEPVQAALARLEAQPQRRFIKSHLPADGLPLHNSVRYVHVARDAAMSFRNNGRPCEKWSSVGRAFGPNGGRRMARRKHEPEGIVAKLRRVDVPVPRRPVAGAVRAIGVTSFTRHRRREESGGPKSDRAKRLKDPEENERLRKAVSDLTLGKPILREAAWGNFRAPPAVAGASRAS